MYDLVPDKSVDDQVAALPSHALAAYTDVLEVLRLTPWNGSPVNGANPDGPVRRWNFGYGYSGHVLYLILEEQREVHVLLVQWFGA